MFASDYIVNATALSLINVKDTYSATVLRLFFPEN